MLWIPLRPSQEGTLVGHLGFLRDQSSHWMVLNGQHHILAECQELAFTKTGTYQDVRSLIIVSTFVIVEKAERSDIPNIDKKKYLVPADLTVGQFVYVIRKRIKLSAEKAIFIFVDNALPPTGAIMSAIYEEQKDEDGFLYVTYSGENTFGDQILK
ncbi:unnamed protein product [Ilex paraguariensis]|uniref:Autophagy-related protein n=2 Tax=Ilex paraguariensis TaxID=185542 RepID=A0ABC8TUS5_9AQUA